MVDIGQDRDIVFNESLQQAPEQCRRIPRELQDIFVASNRGEEVHVPPKNSLASKVFVYRPPPYLQQESPLPNSSRSNNKNSYNGNNHKISNHISTETVFPVSRRDMMSPSARSNRPLNGTTNSSRHSRTLFQRTIGRWSTRNFNNISSSPRTRKMKDKSAAFDDDANEPKRHSNRLSNNLTKLLLDTNIIVNTMDPTTSSGNDNDILHRRCSKNRINNDPSAETKTWKSRWNTVISSIAFANRKKKETEKLNAKHPNNSTTTLTNDSFHLNNGPIANQDDGDDDDEVDEDGNRFDGINKRRTSDITFTSNDINNSNIQKTSSHRRLVVPITVVRRNGRSEHIRKRVMNSNVHTNNPRNTVAAPTIPTEETRRNSTSMMDNNTNYNNKKNGVVDDDDCISQEDHDAEQDDIVRNVSPVLIHKRLLGRCPPGITMEQQNHRHRLQNVNPEVEKVFIPSVGVMNDCTSTTGKSSSYLGQDDYFDDLMDVSDRDGTTITTTPSLFNNGNNNQKKSGATVAVSTNTLQLYFDTLLSSRGYCTNKYSSIHTGYHNDATPLQEASYQSYIVNVVTNNDCATFERLLKCGLSTNPSNYYGESIMHIVCKLGYTKMLQIMIDVGASVQISDDIGRTPLHSACWGYTNSKNNSGGTNLGSEPTLSSLSSPSLSSSSTSSSYFETIEVLLRQDIYLMNVYDSRGSTPLSYIRTEHWPEWITFFQTKKDLYWPEKKSEHPNNTMTTSIVETPNLPSIIYLQPNTKPTRDPHNALDIPLARFVASGQMEPEDAALIQNDDDDEEEEEEEEEDNEENDSDDGDNSEDDEEDNRRDIKMDGHASINALEVAASVKNDHDRLFSNSNGHCTDDDTFDGCDKNEAMQMEIKRCMEVVHSAMKTKTTTAAAATATTTSTKVDENVCTGMSSSAVVAAADAADADGGGSIKSSKSNNNSNSSSIPNNRLVHCKDSVQGSLSQNTSVLDGTTYDEVDEFDDDLMEAAIRAICLKKRQEEQEKLINDSNNNLIS